MNKDKKTVKTTTKYKAVDPMRFSTNYTEDFPKYIDLCKGEAVELDVKNPMVVDWLNNNIIVKE